jgi:Protein of unknown function (DUF3224)
LEVDMSNRATASFKIEGWDEETYADVEGGRKLSRASVKQAISGDIEGEGSVEWLMCYRPDKTADFVGLQRIEGRLGDRSGSFVLLQTDGTFDGAVASGELAVVPGSGTGDLEGISGKGDFRAPHGEPAQLTLEYELS